MGNSAKYIVFLGAPKIIFLHELENCLSRADLTSLEFQGKSKFLILLKIPSLLFHFDSFAATASLCEQRLVFMERLLDGSESISLELEELDLLVGELEEVYDKVWKKYFELKDSNATPEEKGLAKREMRLVSRECFTAQYRQEQLRKKIEILTTSSCCLCR